MGMDGAKWTAAFMKLHSDKLPDEGNMLGWFCNAIMAGYDTAANKLQMVISHATGGSCSDVSLSTNDICVQITANRNMIYQAGKDAALTPTPKPEPDVREKALAFVEKHCAGPKGYPLTVCSSPSLADWNEFRAALRPDARSEEPK
jgi:hypothetical protein